MHTVRPDPEPGPDPTAAHLLRRAAGTGVVFTLGNLTGWLIWRSSLAWTGIVFGCVLTAVTFGLSVMLRRRNS